MWNHYLESLSMYLSFNFLLNSLEFTHNNAQEIAYNCVTLNITLNTGLTLKVLNKLKEKMNFDISFQYMLMT